MPAINIKKRALGDFEYGLSVVLLAMRLRYHLYTHHHHQFIVIDRAYFIGRIDRLSIYFKLVKISYVCRQQAMTDSSYNIFIEPPFIKNINIELFILGTSSINAMPSIYQQREICRCIFKSILKVNTKRC